MADAATAGPVFRLMYSSHLRIPEHERKAQLGAIRQGVTGALLVWHDNVVQALEGDEATVRELYEAIRRDPRHERIAVLEEGTVPERTFGRWSMARVSDDDDEPDIPLLMNRDKGGISPAAPRATTPEEDAVVATMREYARGSAQPA